MAHRLRLEGWVRTAILEMGCGRGAGLEEMLSTGGDMVGVKGLGDPGSRCLGSHGSSGKRWEL